MALAAAERFGVRAASLSLVNCGENITYRVRSATQAQWLLRLHRPVYHNAAEVSSELAWLRALRATGMLPVPEPVQAPSGDWVLSVAPAGGGPAHVCTLLRWLEGRHRWGTSRPSQFRALGRTMARLHLHSRAWQPPAGFTRPALGWKGLLGPDSNWGSLPAGLPSLFEPSDRLVVKGALRRIGAAMDSLDREGAGRTLIHADLHLGNVIFAGGQACPIDFDDCGDGYLGYDLATTLSPFQGRADWPAVRDTLLAGYSDVAPLPGSQMSYLPEFLTTRSLTMTLWLAMRSRWIPRLGQVLTSHLPRAVQRCRELLACA
jgi:Ser/Thr protein kinase RdoA (MazF antagonist)